MAEQRNPDEPLSASELELIWEFTSAPEPTAGGWEALQKRLDAGDPADAGAPRRAASPTRRWSWWTVPLAASALIVVGIGLGRVWTALRWSQAQPTTIAVPVAARARVQLPGGVQVRMNYASTLSYRPSAKVEEVELDGEAYFIVPKEEGRVFRVRTDAGIIADLGTEFNVKARAHRVAVVVTRGEVALKSAGETVVLRANEISHAVAGKPPARPTPANLEASLAWTVGRLVFYNEPLENIAAELERRYGTSFDVAPGLRSKRITATIREESNASDAAKLVCLSVQTRCERGEGGWRIGPR